MKTPTKSNTLDSARMELGCQVHNEFVTKVDKNSTPP